MRPKPWAIAVLLLLCRTAFAAQPASPVNPHASPEARALLAYLCSVCGNFTLTGQHNYPDTIATWTEPDGWIPPASTLDQPLLWSWFLIDPAGAMVPEAARRLGALYASPHVQGGISR
ncbi:MAG TPA: hypothetical protein VMU80_29180 [Bryobacteraceae bacterium]|nr:hypothetical protein [Bryobacteraceae bacterium]